MKPNDLPPSKPNGGYALLAYDRLFRKGEKVSTFQLEKQRYRLTARYVVVGGKYKIFELLPIDSSSEAEVSFLTPDIKEHGVIIPNSYREHKTRLKLPATSSVRITKARDVDEAAENVKQADFSSPPIGQIRRVV